MKKASIKGRNINHIADMGGIIEASPCENITKVHANKKPSHIEPPSPRNIFHFFPIRPRVNKRKRILFKGDNWISLQRSQITKIIEGL